MGQNQSGSGGGGKDGADKEKKKYEPPVPTRVGKKKKRAKGPVAASKLPLVTPHARCRLKLLKLERIKDYLLMEEEFLRNQERLKPQEEKHEEERSKVDDHRGSPMSVGTLEEIIDDNHAIVSTSVGSEHYVSILSFVDKDQLEPGCSVLLNHKVHAVVGVLSDDTDPMVTVMKLEKAPQETYADIGGLDQQIQEIKESVELPLTHPEYYEEMGIRPPKGVILYGPPGTGKTLLAKAVANQTSATFLRVVGSELIQKYLGDGPKLVRELFRVAEEHAPSIVFIDEIDAVGTKRYDSNSGGEREIQRTMLELLNQLDGFDSRGDVKVVMATNRIETLDPALIRPGRIDRKIEFPLPDEKTKRRIFTIHTARMTLAGDVAVDELVMAKDDLSGADIKAICTEAGLMALRERRMKVTNEDFKNAILLAKKKALNTAGDILIKGATNLRGATQQEQMGRRVCPDFHSELLSMRQAWRLRKAGNSILGDISYKSAGSRFWQSGTFEVAKSAHAMAMYQGDHSQGPEPQRPPSSVKITLPSELEGISYIQVTIQKDTETIASGQLSINLPQDAFSNADTPWQQRLEAAQNVLFCNELFAQLAREAVQLQPSIPNLVVGNQITSSLFPGVQLSIGLCHRTLNDRKVQAPQSRLDHKHVLEHSLHQLLREYHYNMLHHAMPHPASAPLGLNKRQRLAGPEAFDRHTIMDMSKNETILEKIIAQTQHVVLRLRTMYMIDQYACEIKDPLIVAHWVAMFSPTHNSVKVKLVSHGYETMCRTPLVIHVGEKSLKAVLRDGRVIKLSYEPPELRFLLMSQVAQHQVNAVQTLAKYVGWKVLSTCGSVGVGGVEPLGNASSVVMASPNGEKILAVRVSPGAGVKVSLSSCPQQQDFYPSSLVKDRKWHLLNGPFKEVSLERMQGKTFLNKMEHLMAALTTS
ncbi:mediator of RNA polymerase II transcription subunit 17 [Galendromus occidentalis]|uniref:Mediator of RNA polymerase II transcription subunit 17 n=1 Tax=Galendromus occidentalis TaxID=34638 RepID=A0AAJ7WIB4_9ACAR|nr:mediator of RNA polymerase II transcription subunit 17 [Galendromus occidentalis]